MRPSLATPNTCLIAAILLSSRSRDVYCMRAHAQSCMQLNTSPTLFPPHRTVPYRTVPRTWYIYTQWLVLIFEMSHLAYPNLARLSNFPERGLNYTGITLEGWDSPVLLVPVVIAVFTVMTAGAPWSRGGGGWEIWWALLNTVIIHPMD